MTSGAKWCFFGGEFASHLNGGMIANDSEPQAWRWRGLGIGINASESTLDPGQSPERRDSPVLILTQLGIEQKQPTVVFEDNSGLVSTGISHRMPCYTTSQSTLTCILPGVIMPVTPASVSHTSPGTVHGAAP
eukprot:2892136-Rhodomonas_salina.1